VQHSLNNKDAPTSGLAIASLVLGIVSIIGCFLYGLPSVICGPLAIYFANRAKKQYAAGEASASSRGMAQAGFVCGIIGTCFAVIGIGFVLFLFIIPLVFAAGGGFP